MGSAAPKHKTAWTLDRNWHRAEAERHLRARDYVVAERHLAMAVEEADRREAPAKQRIRLRLEMADAKRRTANLNDPAEKIQAQRILASAEAIARFAIQIAADAGDKEEYVNCLDTLAEIFADQQAYPELEKAEEEAVRLGAQLDHPDPLRMAKRVHRLAHARHKNGHGEHSLPALEKSIQLHEQNYGPASIEMADLRYEAGTIYRAEHQHDKAQECFRRAMNIHIREEGFESPEATKNMHQLAGSLEESGDLDGAAAIYERCLTMQLRKIGVQHIDEVATMQYSLANLHVGWGNLARARELLTDSIGVFKRDGGVRLAVAHETLAQIEERTGRYNSALTELESAAKVWKKCEGRTAELLRNLNYQVDLLDQLRKVRQVEWLRREITEIEQAAAAPEGEEQAPQAPEAQPA